MGQRDIRVKPDAASPASWFCFQQLENLGKGSPYRRFVDAMRAKGMHMPRPKRRGMCDFASAGSKTPE
jgi:hypothetical protein